MICTVGSAHWQQASKSLLPYWVHRACYNSMEWLRYTSVHHHHNHQPILAAGFKAYNPTERTEHAAIAWSDCAIFISVHHHHNHQPILAAVFKAYNTTQRTEHATIARSDCAIQVCIIIIITSPYWQQASKLTTLLSAPSMLQFHGVTALYKWTSSSSSSSSTSSSSSSSTPWLTAPCQGGGQQCPRNTSEHHHHHHHHHHRQHLGWLLRVKVVDSSDRRYR